MRYGAVGDGNADDSAAIATALLAAKAGAERVVLPGGYKFKITRYLRIYSRTTIHLIGTLHLTNRRSGLYCDSASDISIYGFKVGTITDTAVAADYRWNAGSAIIPAVHLRSVSNALIDGLNITYVSQGILVSNATDNTAAGAAFELRQAPPANVVIRNCSTTFTEFGGITCYSGRYVTYEGNYVYRSGDGGMWMMGCIDSQVLNNIRLSPYANPADVAAHGPNAAEFPTTWNDEQGMEFEACYSLTIRGNVVKGFWSQAIDIKNSCNWVDVIDNRVSDCENSSIIVRAGDSVKNSVSKVNISENKIANHGRQQFNMDSGNQAAIAVSDCYIADIVNNAIWGWQDKGTTRPVGILCIGPGKFMASAYPANPHQAAVNISGNKIHFGADAAEAFNSYSFLASTLGAILIKGQYDSVTCDSNQITTDDFLPSDRVSAGPAIGLTYTVFNGNTYPAVASISSNMIDNWGLHGIQVDGQRSIASSGLSVCNNTIGQPKGHGILLANVSRAIIGNNTIKQPGSGKGFAAIRISGSPEAAVDGIICTANLLTGRTSGGPSNMTYGIHTSYAGEVHAENNSIAGATASNVMVEGAVGSHNFSGTTGFFRAADSPPNGTVKAYWRGEMYLDRTTGKWWTATDFNSTIWTPLGG